jgi:FlaG/FlaF family flagellin (archaellin)
MSDAVVFSIGAVVFLAATSATLVFGYLRFNELQREDAAAEEAS